VGTGGECNVDDEDPDVDEEKNKVNVAKTLHSCKYNFNQKIIK